MEIVRRWGPAAWACALALLMLGPALGPGFVLTYDMVWVPDLALRADFLGTGTGLPRAVPSDAVIAALDEVVPGALLQKIVLLVGLVLGAAGIDRWLRGIGLPGRFAAVTFFVWNPFVVERLLIGHWPVLLCFAVVPWVAWTARQAGERDAERARLPVALLLLVPLGSLSASAGLMTALVLLVFGAGRIRPLLLAALVACANAPWVVAGVLHVGVASSDPDAAALFAPRGEGMLPGPLAALGLGGIWNSEVVPTTREGVLAVGGLVVLVGVAALGLRGARAGLAVRDQRAFVVLWLVGWALAVLTWLVPDAFAWLAAHVPGGGMLRDGSRMLGLCAPAVALLLGHGVDRTAQLLESWSGERGQAAFVASMLALVPVATMPDAAWGASGALRAVHYPASYDATAGSVPKGERVLIVPFTSYRAPAWNHGRKVLDPMGRFLDEDFVASDELVVADHQLQGEDPLGADVREALARGDAASRAAALGGLGIGAVVVETDTGLPVPEIAGRRVAASADHEIVVLSEVSPRRVPVGWSVAMAIAWTMFVGLLGWALILGLRRALRRNS